MKVKAIRLAQPKLKMELFIVQFVEFPEGHRFATNIGKFYQLYGPTEDMRQATPLTREAAEINFQDFEIEWVED